MVFPVSASVDCFDVCEDLPVEDCSADRADAIGWRRTLTELTSGTPLNSSPEGSRVMKALKKARASVEDVAGRADVAHARVGVAAAATTTSTTRRIGNACHI